jgi:hypothetical protein
MYKPQGVCDMVTPDTATPQHRWEFDIGIDIVLRR